MQDAIRKMLDLQELDREVSKLRKELQAKPAALSREESALKDAEKELETLKGQIRDLQKLVDGRNVDLRASEEAIKKLEAQAQTLKTNAEYAAMQKQIAGKKGEVGTLEEKILEGMEVVETAKKGLPAKETEVKAKQQALAKSREKIAAELAANQKRLAELEVKWKERSKAVPHDVLGAYLYLRERHGATVVAELTPEAVCQGCYMSVTPARLNQAMGGGFVQCTSCERFLYMN